MTNATNALTSTEAGAKNVFSLRALVHTTGRWAQFWRKIDQPGLNAAVGHMELHPFGDKMPNKIRRVEKNPIEPGPLISRSSLSRLISIG